MYRILEFKNQNRLYEDLLDKIVDLLKDDNRDFIVILPNQSLINRIIEDITLKYKVIFDFKLYTFDDLVKMDLILEEETFKELYSRLILRKSLEDCIEAKTIEDNIFFNSQGFLSIANKFNNLIKESNLQLEVLKEAFGENKAYTSVYHLLKKYASYENQFQFSDKFKIYENFIKRFNNKQGIRKVFIAGFSKLNPLELTILKKLQDFNIKIDMYFLNSLKEMDLPEMENLESLKSMGFDYFQVEEFRQPWSFQSKVVKCEDEILELKRLAIEIKRDLLKNPDLKSCIIVRNADNLSEIQKIFQDNNMVLGIKEDLKILDSPLGKELWNLYSLDRGIGDYLMSNYKNLLLFEDDRNILDFERILCENNFNTIDELIFLEEFKSLDDYPIIYDRLRIIQDKILSVEGNLKNLEFVLDLIEDYLEENELSKEDLEFEFYKFLRGLFQGYGDLIEDLSKESFVNFFKDILNDFKIRSKIEENHNIELTSFEMFSLLNYDNLYFICFDDCNYPLKETTNYYFNNWENSKYKSLGMYLQTNRERYYGELLDFSNFFDEYTNKVYLSYSSEEEKVLSPFIHIIDRDIEKDDYGLKDYIRPKPEEVISIKDKNKYLSSYKRPEDIEGVCEILEDEQFRNEENSKVTGFGIKSDSTNKYMSSSQLETYISCPVKYFYKYILKIEDFFKPRVDVIKIGSAVHETFRILYEDYRIYLNPGIKNQKLIEGVFYKQLKLQDYTINQNSQDTVKRYVYLMDKTLDKDLAYLRENELVPIAFEEKFNDFIEIGDERVYIYGIIDRIDRDRYGNLHIVDYKLGKSGIMKYDDFYKKGESLQFPIYGSIKNACSCRYICVDTMSVEEFYSYYVEGVFSPKYLNSMIIRMNEIISQVRDSISKENYFIGSGSENICRFCEYKDFCRYR